jgi:hypothetical protein
MPTPTLSFTESKTAKPIAYVKGGDDDKQVLYLHEDKPSIVHRSKKEINAKHYQGDLLKFPARERVGIMNRLTEAKMKGVPVSNLIEPENVKALYEKVLHDEENEKEIDLNTDSMFQPIPPPDPKTRTVWYIAGASGSGKSYFARGLAEAYKKLYPEREVYLISKLKEDETLDKMKIGKPKRINVDTLVENPPEIEEFQNCMIIFDDYDTFQPPYFKVVMRLIDDLAIQGRHTNTTMLCLTHYLSNYKNTRLILNEMTHLVVYPQATAFKPLKYLLETHLGLDKDAVAQLKRIGSRWVCFGKNYPQTQISEHSAKLLN